jgi:CRISPR/Cas system CSM-associated protein Csm3 (group 7 of RAMP superfamily)
VEELAGLLAGWRPFIGRGASRGRGRCVAERVRHGTLNVDEPEGMLRWLTMSGPGLAHAVAVTDMQAEAQDDEPVLRATLSICGPWRIGSSEPPPKEAQGDREHEVIPLLKTAGGFLVPGSGLKGVLQSRAEFILRSTGVIPPPCLDQQCEDCLTCQVFGYGGGKDTESGSVGARSAIRVAGAVVDQPEPVRRTHIAIDRFTGGVLDGALYEVEALEAGTFTIQVEQLTVLAEERLTEIRAVLRLVLADLDDGIIGVGAGVARGYGSVRVVPDGGLPSVAEARRVLAGLVKGGAHVPA